MQILKRVLSVFGFTAPGVEILNAEEDPAPNISRPFPGLVKDVGMAQMQISGGGWGNAADIGNRCHVFKISKADWRYNAEQSGAVRPELRIFYNLRLLR